MRVAIASCAFVPEEFQDDPLLAAALRRREASVGRIAWDDPAINWHGFDLVVVRSTWDYTRRRDRFLAWAEGIGERLRNRPQVIRWNSDKRYLADLADRGIPVVPTVWGPDALDEAAARGWQELIVKPAVSAGARDTFRVPAGEARDTVGRVAHRGEVMVQPYLGSVAEHGELSVVLVDGAPTHAVLKRPAEGEFRVQLELGGAMRRITLDEETERAARRVVEAVDQSLLYARVDMLRDDDGQLLLAELEVTEPSLYLSHAPEVVDVLAEAVLGRL